MRPARPVLPLVALLPLAGAWLACAPSSASGGAAPSAAPEVTPTEPPPLLQPSSAEPEPDVPVEADRPEPVEAPPADTRTSREIQSVIAEHRQTVRDCYDAALRENPGIQGDLVVSFRIDPEGVVQEAEVNWQESEIHVPELDTCAAEAIQAMRFPPSSRGLESRVNYPFNFNPPKQPPPGPPPDKRHR